MAARQFSMIIDGFERAQRRTTIDMLERYGVAYGAVMLLERLCLWTRLKNLGGPPKTRDLLFFLESSGLRAERS